MRKVYIVLLTGGPCGGKDTALVEISDHLMQNGIIPVTIEEQATSLQRSGFDKSLHWRTTYGFQEAIARHQLAEEEMYRATVAEYYEDKDVAIICNRGIMDGQAYVGGPEAFEPILKRVGLERAEALGRYDVVIHLVTAADGAVEHYTLANNKHRDEPPALAIAVDRATQDAYIGHSCRFIIGNDVGWNEKMRRTCAALARVIGTPEPLQRERKYQVSGMPEDMLKRGVPVTITQTYLRPLDEHTRERRVRVTLLYGIPQYTYSEKVKLDVPGERIERRRVISADEYQSLLTQASPSGRTLYKTRTHFNYDNQAMHYDTFFGEHEGLHLLEVPVATFDTPVRMPGAWHAEDVTGNIAFTNWALAHTH